MKHPRFFKRISKLFYTFKYFFSKKSSNRAFGTNSLLWPPIYRNKSAITPKWFNSLDTNSRASQIVNFTLILHFGLSDNLAWPVVSVCSLMIATSKRLLQSFTFIFYYDSDLFKIFLYFSRHFNKMQSFTFIFYYISDLFKIFSLNFKTF